MPIDYKKYPIDWFFIRERILKRSANCCEECGAENYSLRASCKPDGKNTEWIDLAFEDLITVPYKKVKVILTIAHLDHDETNHQVTDDRLKAMCQLCHLRYDSPEKARRRKLKNF